MNRIGLLFLLVVTMLAVSCKKDVIENVCPPNNGGGSDTVVYNPDFFDIPTPAGFFQMQIPANNPTSVQGVALGKKLFYDVRLSGDNTQSCASCHIASASFTDTARFSKGITGAIGDRNAMAIVNLGFEINFFWDGRSGSLEEQALEPVTNPIEMNATWEEVLVKLNADTVYRRMFKEAFNVNVIDSHNVAFAIAQFERTMVSANSKYDRVNRGEDIFTPLETTGLQIFTNEKGDCFHCHSTAGGTFTGFQFENNGLQATIVDEGRGGVTGLSTDNGRFKPTTLRNIALTAPYMHDGRFNTLEEVVEFYNSGVNQNSPNISPVMTKANRPNGQLNLTPYEKEALVAFLRTLTDTSYTQNPAYLQ